MDTGPFGKRSVLYSANNYGCHHGLAAEDDTDCYGSNAAKDNDVPAGDIYIPIPNISIRSCALLACKQCPQHHTTVLCEQETAKARGLTTRMHRLNEPS
jgi:hypothetical protein